MTTDSRLRDLMPVLGQYPSLGPLGDVDVRPLGSAGGYSGAQFWRLRTVLGDCCLRRWPREHPPADRLMWMHRVLRAASQLDFIPCPVAAAGGDSFVTHQRHLWQIERWLPGNPIDRSAIGEPHIRAAFSALGRFHAVVAAKETTRLAPVPAISDRLKLHRSFQQSLVDQIGSAPIPDRWPNLAACRDRAIEQFARDSAAAFGQLTCFERHRTDLIPCIRDLRLEHVLFSDSRVTGIVDFGAMRMDSAATDLARLIDEMTLSDRLLRVAINSYCAHRPLPKSDGVLVGALLASSGVLAPLMWLKWILVDRRQFFDQDRVTGRIARLTRPTGTFDSTIASNISDKIVKFSQS